MSEEIDSSQDHRGTMRMLRLVPIALAAGTTAVAVTAAPAHATLASAALTISDQYDLVTGCTLTSGSSFTATKPFQDDGVPVTASASANQVFTGSTSADQVNVSEHARSTVTVVGQPHQLVSLKVTTQASSSAVAALGSATTCGAQNGYGVATPTFTFHVTSPGWVTLRRTVSDASGATAAVSGLTNTVNKQAWEFGGFYAGSGTARVRLPMAGDYEFEEEDAAVSYAHEPDHGPTKSSVSTTVTATLTPFGTATGGASGSGKPYVSLPGSVNCAGHKAVAGLTGQISKASSVRFAVNGVTKRTINRPRKGNVTITGFPGQGDVSFKASVRLKTGATKTVTRSYIACG